MKKILNVKNKVKNIYFQNLEWSPIYQFLSFKIAVKNNSGGQILYTSPVDSKKRRQYNIA